MLQTLRDQAITHIVRTRLGEDRDTCDQTIDVCVADGDLFLIGWCDEESQRITAVRIAKGAYGVRTVIDNIRVRKIVQSV